MICQGHVTILGFNFEQDWDFRVDIWERFRYLGSILEQTIDFCGHCWEKMNVQFKINFRKLQGKILILGMNLWDSFQKPTEFTTLQVKVLNFWVYFFVMNWDFGSLSHLGQSSNISLPSCNWSVSILSHPPPSKHSRKWHTYVKLTIMSWKWELCKIYPTRELGLGKNWTACYLDLHDSRHCQEDRVNIVYWRVGERDGWRWLILTRITKSASLSVYLFLVLYSFLHRKKECIQQKSNLWFSGNFFPTKYIIIYRVRVCKWSFFASWRHLTKSTLN